MAKLMLAERDGGKVGARPASSNRAGFFNSYGKTGEKLLKEMVPCPRLYVFK